MGTRLLLMTNNECDLTTGYLFF